MDFNEITQAFLALVFVLALIGILVAAARKLGFGYPTTLRSTKDRRLGILEVLPVDARRRIVLVRRDDTEHLILLGATSETIIESPVPGTAKSFARALTEQAEELDLSRERKEEG